MIGLDFVPERSISVCIAGAAKAAAPEPRWRSSQGGVVLVPADAVASSRSRIWQQVPCGNDSGIGLCTLLCGCAQRPGGAHPVVDHALGVSAAALRPAGDARARRLTRRHTGGLSIEEITECRG